MLDANLLNILACPDCKIDLLYHRVGEKEELLCPNCSRVFEIKDGIPLMMPKKH